MQAASVSLLALRPARFKRWVSLPALGFQGALSAQAANKPFVAGRMLIAVGGRG